MKAFVFIFAGLVVAASAQATSITTGDCFKKVAVSNQWPSLTVAQLQCLEADSDFVDGMAFSIFSPPAFRSDHCWAEITP